MRLLRCEGEKLLARRLPLFAFFLVVGVALLAPRVGRAVDTATALASSGRPHAPDPFENGWTALAGAVAAARAFLVIVVLILSASAVAEESSQRTLKTLFLRPVRRGEVLFAKALSVWAYGALLLLAVVGAAALSAELDRGLYDVVDPDYPDRLTHAFGDMCAYVYAATALTLLPLAALTCLGLLAGVLFEHPGHATGVAIGGLFVASAASGLSDGLGDCLFVDSLAAPFATVSDLAGQYATARRGFAAPAVLRAILVPALWSVGLFAAAALLLARRDIDR